MDCHGGAAVSQALQGNIVHGHLPHEGDIHGPGMEDAMPMEAGGDWAGDFQSQPPDAMHMDPMAAMEAERVHAESEWAAQFEANDGAMADEFLAQQAAMSAGPQQEIPEDDWTAQFQQNEGEEWAQDFNDDEVKVFGVEGEAVATVEEKTRDSKFYDFMNKVRTGEIHINEEEGKVEVRGPGEGDWVNEFANQANPADGMGEEWASEMQRRMAEMAEDEEDDEYRAEWEEAMRRQEEGEEYVDDFLGQGEGDENNFLQQYMKRYGDGEGGEFADEYLANEEGEDWLEEYKDMEARIKGVGNSTDYPFDPNNPFLFHDNPFDEGMQLLAAGTLSEAVLAFEAVCQKEPERVEGWQYLGTTQAENEKDGLAIRALNKCREISPANLAVHMALAVSHTNETNHTQALQSLRAWVLAHAEYESLASITAPKESPTQIDGVEPDFAKEFLFVSASEHRDVCHLFNAALEINRADGELHVGLGILRNLSHEFDLAAECFKEAINLKPNDEKLWNKLGATLANGNRSREALDAYDKALDICPGFVRAQYNLGIAHSNLGEHQLAARHFLRAIVMQQGGVQIPDPPTRSTKEIWDVLRMTFNLMERSDLVERTWKQNVGEFLDEFGLSDLMV